MENTNQDPIKKEADVTPIENIVTTTNPNVISNVDVAPVNTEIQQTENTATTAVPEVEPVETPEIVLENNTPKSFGNTDVNAAKKNVKDIVVFGDGDTFKLICKASSKSEGWMKSTKAMVIHGLGCVIQVTTQQGDNVAEALTFVPGAKIHETFSSEEGKEDLVISRRLIM